MNRPAKSPAREVRQGEPLTAQHRLTMFFGELGHALAGLTDAELLSCYAAGSGT